MSELVDARRVHVVGAGGAGMSSLAKLLAQMGHTVSGSDLKPSPALDALSDLGLKMWVGSRPQQAVASDLVVASSAVPPSDPELSAARAAGIEVWGRPELLAALTSRMPAVGISGTHGKTTSTALAVTALRAAGRDPSFVLGGEITGLGTSAHLGERDLFVLEADEAFGTFLPLRLAGLLVTNVEADHLDYYHSLDRLEEAFAEVVGRVKGPVVVGVDNPGGRRLAEHTDAATFGVSEGATWRIVDLAWEPGGVRFTLQGPPGPVGVEVCRQGANMAGNAAGVLALLGECGHDLQRAARGLRDFGGVRRRFEVRGRIKGVTIIDDYAHHPTEVAAALQAARRGSWHQVWAVFQPHRYSRTAELHRQFGPAFAAADRVVVTDVYGAGEPPEPGVSGTLVAQAVVEATERPVAYLPHRADLAGYLAERVEPGDLVLTMGAGDITLLPDELARQLTGSR
ncbi:MAG: UDP-N-acetylmuramate--L-alanine ligase [Actinomycetota bacterium]|nr:UDP-N-acetylmuramate--L-alanine ligase [Actinomycetota bacterium]